MKSYEETAKEVLTARDCYDKKQNRRKKTFRHIGVFAACFIVLFGITARSFNVVAAEKEYKEAIAFFEENDLEIEGLTKSEVRKIYRDIKTKSFTYGKTGEVLRATITKKGVEGFEIENSVVNETLSANELWEIILKSTNSLDSKKSKISAGIRYNLTKNYGDANNHYVYVTLSAYEGDKLIFERNVNADTKDGSGYHVEGLMAVSDGVYLYGTSSSLQLHKCTMVSKYNDDGKLLFAKVFDYGYSWYNLYAKAEKNGDLTLILNDNAHHGVLRIDGEGKTVLFRQYEGRIGDCFEYGDGYLLTVGDYTDYKMSIKKLECLDHDGILTLSQDVGFNIKYLVKSGSNCLLITSDKDGNTSLVTLDSEGRLCNDRFFESDGRKYLISSVTEYEGRIWLSCAEVIPTDGKTKDPILDIFPDPFGFGDLNQQQLTELASHYKATLLVCDVNDYEPEIFYTAYGASFQEMSNSAEIWNFPGADEQFSITDEGYLAWTVGKIIAGSYAPYSGRRNFQVYGEPCTYLFDKDGSLIGVNQVETENQSIG